MEEEIQGKRENNAWKDVLRPPGIFVHKSRWVFAVKLHDDNSVKLVKARFVSRLRLFATRRQRLHQ
eukprot:1467484-Prymnesium_polylepis.1